MCRDVSDARGNARARRLAPDRIAACQARRTRCGPCHARQTKRPAHQSDRPTARPLRCCLMNQGALCSRFQEVPNVGVKYPVHLSYFDRRRKCVQRIMRSSPGSEPVGEADEVAFVDGSLSTMTVAPWTIL